ncbi:hypothetical protein [Vannielia sp.]|uniref:hypothetical protein n=1 Tax=Vannielia sp. TaxID=2813045 RepID=UPI0026192E71|nr:hypothetical protein [Vannielia sp.]MDF1873923.1 hypothetical protein [Vannielia sp.]
MGRLKTLFMAGLLACHPPAASADALENRFTACTGRLSALMEHQWLIASPEADRTKARRDAMISLLEAVMPKNRGREVLARRIEAKYAQSVLLTRATFGQNAEDAAWAQRRAEAEIAQCAALLIG